jgi:hypothetical protein
VIRDLDRLGGGVKTQVVQLDVGGAAANAESLVSSSNPLPVSAASLPLPTGAATAAGVAAVVTALGTPAQAGGAVSVSNFPVTQPVSGTVAVKTAAAGNAPASVSVGVASGAAVAANASRKGLTLVNTSAAVISLGFDGAPAVLNSGVTLVPYGSFTMDSNDFSVGAVTAIASAAASNMAVQEWQ